MNVSKLRRIFRDLASYTEGATTVLIKDTENRTFFLIIVWPVHLLRTLSLINTFKRFVAVSILSF